MWLALIEALCTQKVVYEYHYKELVQKYKEEKRDVQPQSEVAAEVQACRYKETYTPEGQKPAARFYFHTVATVELEGAEIPLTRILHAALSTLGEAHQGAPPAG